MPLFQEVREALESLTSEALNQDDQTGGEIGNDGLRALGQIEAAIREIAAMQVGASQAVLAARRLL